MEYLSCWDVSCSSYEDKKTLYRLLSLSCRCVCDDHLFFADGMADPCRSILRNKPVRSKGIYDCLAKAE
jgi:hypothetical protein